MDLRARLSGASDLARAEGLLDEWFGVRLAVPLTVLDDTGFPIAFAELRDAVNPTRPVGVRFDAFDIDVVDAADDVVPGRHGWVRAPSSRGLWSGPPFSGGGPSELVSVDIGNYLFRMLLDLISWTAPVRLELAMLDAHTLEDVVSRLEPIDPDARRPNSRAGATWFAAESVLVSTTAHDRMWVFGQRKQDVEAVVPATLALYREWQSTERMHEPATDDVHLHESSIRDDARPTRRDLREVFAIADPMTALAAFLESWSGEMLPDVADVPPDVPPALARVDACPRVQELFGGIDHFDGPRGDRTEDAFEMFWVQHQGVAFIGYQPGDPDPVVFIFHSFEPDQPRWSMGLTMSRFLYRTGVSVAADRAPCKAVTQRATPDDVQRVRDIFPVVLPREGAESPAFRGFGEVRSDGQILVTCGEHAYGGWIEVSAHHRDEIANPPFSAIGGWTWYRSRR